MVRQPFGGFKHLDHILRAGRLIVPDDVVYLRVHTESSRSRENVGLLPLLDDSDLAAFVGSRQGRWSRSFRI